MSVMLHHKTVSVGNSLTASCTRTVGRRTCLPGCFCLVPLINNINLNRWSRHVWWAHWTERAVLVRDESTYYIHLYLLEYPQYSHTMPTLTVDILWADCLVWAFLTGGPIVHFRPVLRPTVGCSHGAQFSARSGPTWAPKGHVCYITYTLVPNNSGGIHVLHYIPNQQPNKLANMDINKVGTKYSNISFANVLWRRKCIQL